MQNELGWLDEVYADYDVWKDWSSDLKSPHERRLIDIELARAGVAPPARVLEIGFGAGTLLLYLNSLGYECWGIERRDAHDEDLSRQGVTIRSGDVVDLPHSYFDLVCVFDVFEHLERPKIVEMLRKIAMVLKPGGRLLARFPNGASPFGAMIQSGDLTHLSTLSILSFSQACSVAGLQFIGGWNSAVSWRADGIVRSIAKPFLLVGRRLTELVIGALYFGERRPLDVNVTVCAKRHDD